MQQLYNPYNSPIEHSCNGPDEPAVLGLEVPGRTVGIEQKNGGDDQPVNGTDDAKGGTQLLLGRSIIALLQKLLESRVYGIAIDKGDASKGYDKNQKTDGSNIGKH